MFFFKFQISALYDELTRLSNALTSLRDSHNNQIQRLEDKLDEKRQQVHRLEARLDNDETEYDEDVKEENR